MFDLGEGREVSRVRVVTDTPGYSFEVRAGDEVPADESALEVVGRSSAVSSTNVVQAGDVAARYWLVWITSLPDGGGGSARIAEVQFFGA